MVAVMAITASGVVSLLLAAPGATPIVTTVAAGYFAFLAYRIATAPPLTENTEFGRQPSFAGGVFLSLVNPKAYAAMAALALISVLCAALLVNRWHGGLVVESLEPHPQTVGGGGNTSKCYNSYAATFKFTTSWQQFTVALDTGDGGTVADVGIAIDPTWGFQGAQWLPAQVYGINWQAQRNVDPGAAPPLMTDIWVDDVYFVE